MPLRSTSCGEGWGRQWHHQAWLSFLHPLFLWLLQQQVPWSRWRVSGSAGKGLPVVLGMPSGRGPQWLQGLWASCPKPGSLLLAGRDGLHYHNQWVIKQPLLAALESFEDRKNFQGGKSDVSHRSYLHPDAFYEQRWPATESPSWPEWGFLYDFCSLPAPSLRKHFPIPWLSPITGLTQRRGLGGARTQRDRADQKTNG